LAALLALCIFLTGAALLVFQRSQTSGRDRRATLAL
jgi:hypothetical protein